MKEILLLPCLLALGVGLSLNNARAVLEAMFNHHSDFARTPKYGIERKSQPWRNCKYMPLKSILPIAEMAFAAYFTYFVWFAIEHGQFLLCPFLIMFQGGFLYVSLSSLAQWWPKFNFGRGPRWRQFPRDNAKFSGKYRADVSAVVCLFALLLLSASRARRNSDRNSPIASSSACAIRS